MGFRLRKISFEDLLFCLVLFGNFWIWRAFSLSLPIFFLLIVSSLVAYGLIKGRGSSLIFLIFLVLLFVFQLRTTTRISLTALSNDDIRLRDQRLKEYPPVLIKVGQRAIWIPVGHWFEGRKETVALSRLTNSLSEVVDPNLYFFANHPRERVGVSEFDKFPYIVFPFFLLGILVGVESKQSKTFFISFLLAILGLSLFGNKNPLGPFALFPFMVSLSALGSQYVIQNVWHFVSKRK